MSRVPALLSLVLGMPAAPGVVAAVTRHATPVPATSSRAPALPAPTGGCPVGATELHLVDENRADPWKPDAARELMVSLRYPTLLPFGERARYMTAAESTAMIRNRGVELSPGVPDTVISTVRTHAVAGAPPVPAPRRRPLIVLSAGFTMPRTSLTVLAEELASRGFVVAGIDHTHEMVVEFPDGRVTSCLACKEAHAVEDHRSVLRKVVRGRARDVSFVLDELTGPHPAWPGGRFIDPSRVGMAGHSIGGAAVRQSMLADERLGAGIDIDGTFFLPPEGAIDRPFVLLGSDRPEDRSWRRAWPELTGWKRWLRLRGANHETFTDWPLLLDQLGTQPPAAAIEPERGLDITRAYVSAFFTRHLLGVEQPLIDADGPAVLADSVPQGLG